MAHAAAGRRGEVDGCEEYGLRVDVQSKDHAASRKKCAENVEVETSRLNLLSMRKMQAQRRRACSSEAATVTQTSMAAAAGGETGL